MRGRYAIPKCRAQAVDEIQICGTAAEQPRRQRRFVGAALGALLGQADQPLDLVAVVGQRYQTHGPRQIDIRGGRHPVRIIPRRIVSVADLQPALGRDAAHGVQQGRAVFPAEQTQGQGLAPIGHDHTIGGKDALLNQSVDALAELRVRPGLAVRRDQPRRTDNLEENRLVNTLANDRLQLGNRAIGR
jgi:hypothetical protein